MFDIGVPARRAAEAVRRQHRATFLGDAGRDSRCGPEPVGVHAVFPETAVDQQDRGLGGVVVRFHQSSRLAVGQRTSAAQAIQSRATARRRVRERRPAQPEVTAARPAGIGLWSLPTTCSDRRRLSGADGRRGDAPTTRGGHGHALIQGTRPTPVRAERHLPLAAEEARLTVTGTIHANPVEVRIRRLRDAPVKQEAEVIADP